MSPTSVSSLSKILVRIGVKMTDEYISFKSTFSLTKEYFFMSLFTLHNTSISILCYFDETNY